MKTTIRFRKLLKHNLAAHELAVRVPLVPVFVAACYLIGFCLDEWYGCAC